MSFEIFVKKLVKFWWVILVSGVVFFLIFIPWLNSVQYAGVLTSGLNFNNSELLEFDESAQAYVDSFDQLSLYLLQRFSSIEIQSKIAQGMGIVVSNINSQRPFYDVTGQGAGFVTVTYYADESDEAKRFVENAKIAYNDIIQEWNQQRLEAFIVTPQSEFIETITEVRPPQQIRLFSGVGGILIGIFIVFLLPLEFHLKPLQKVNT